MNYQKHETHFYLFSQFLKKYQPLFKSIFKLLYSLALIIIMQVINSEIRAFLKNTPNDAALTDFINNLTPQIKPSLKFHQLDIKSLKQPVLVYAHLMVQDIRDSYYYYSFLMKRPFQQQDKFLLYRWGNDPHDHQAEDALENKDYLKVMMDREPVFCTAVAGLSDWAKELQGSPEPIELLVDGRTQFKLGEVINIVAFYYPDHHKLYFVRKVTKEEQEEEGLNLLNKLKNSNIDLVESRQELLSFFSGYCSQTFAEYLLLCMLADDNFFLGADADISQLVNAVYPLVKHLKLVYPAEQSLFPYKNEDGQLITAPLQLSILPTFVSIDLSSFSNKDVVQIGENTINNFKALKIFVEDSRTIYRWQIGESLIDHKHRGVIVKAATFITPHFYPKDQAISPDFSQIKNVEIETLRKFRSYLAKAKDVNPALSIEERAKIQQHLKSQPEKELLGAKLGKVMRLASLLARSYGRQNILISDFERGRFLVAAEVVPKQ